jgi:hypothetical protein
VTTVHTVRDPAFLTSPFVGLTSYAQENAPFFFGRDAEQRVLISNLRASRLTLLYAQSGAGKSSVLRAGVAAKLAELARRSVEQRGFARYIPVVFSSWRDEPTGELVAEIEKAIAPFRPKPSPPGRTPERLDEVIEAASSAAGATLLVVLDQFEEYFLYRPREAHDGRFADELAACINRAGLHANFLISIREDAYSGLGDLFQGRIRNVYSNYLHLEHLTTESAREAIEKPITSFNELHPTEMPVEIEPGLADLILGQLGPDQFAPDQGGIGRLTGGNGSDLPGGEIAASYLQLVMKRLWETELSRGSRTLHRATLEELGGAQTIVRTHVDRALDDLPEEAREAAVDIFHHLVTPSGTKIALAASDLAEYTGRPAAESSTLLERLASSDTRILRPVPPPPGQEGGTRYEISHDLLAPAILDWGGRQRAARLEHEKESAERVARVEKRRARMFRTLALGSGVLLIIAIVALVVAVIAAQTAQRASQNAVHQRDIAVSGQLITRSESLADTAPAISKLLSIAAWRIHPSNATRNAMLAAAARPGIDALNVVGDVATGGWRLGRFSLFPVQQLPAAVLDNRIWLAGGVTGPERATNKTEYYDTTLHQWAPGPNLPFEVHSAMMVNYRGQLWMIGGFLPRGQNMEAAASARVLIFKGDRWVDGPALHHARAAGAAAVVGNKIVVVGGRTGGRSVQEVKPTEVFDGKGWHDATDIPVPGDHLAAVSDGKYLYAIGGRTLVASANHKAVQRFDPATGKWAQLPPLPVANSDMGAAYVGGQLITFGGENAFSVFRTAQSFNLATKTWSTLPNLAEPRHGMGVAVVGKTVYAIDGASQPGHNGSTRTLQLLRLR